MELALYDPEAGYYTAAACRSGRAGDFFTSVDVGPLFGDLISIQIAQMADILRLAQAARGRASDSFDLVESAAGNGRLAADILAGLGRRSSHLYQHICLHLVERSPRACAAQRPTLGELADRLASSADSIPPSFTGVLIANELLDALPLHQVVMREQGLREVYVDLRGGELALHEDAPSTAELAEYLDRLGISLEPGCRAEINLKAVEWMRDAARRLDAGFIIVIDYGHDARELYSATHAGGTLTTFARHTMAGPESRSATSWLLAPGEQDITAHVDFTSVREAAEREGLTTLGFLDQTYFLLALATAGGLAALDGPERVKDRLALKTLVTPGGLGSSHKVLLFGKGVGTPDLVGCSFKIRVT